MIKLSLSGQNLSLTWETREERRAIEAIGSRIPRYSLDSDGDSVLASFEFKKESMEEVMRLNPFVESKAEAFHRQFITESAGLFDLPPIAHLPKFNRLPKPWQAPYISINDLKKRVILSLAQGGGKTAAALMRLEALNDQDKRIVIITPKKVMYDWRTEIRLTYNKDAFLYWATGKKIDPLKQELDKHKIIVTTFEMMKHLDCKADQIIVDECHLIRHEHTKRYKNLKKFLSKNPKAGLQMLSGSPIMDDHEEIYTLVKLVAPTVAGSKAAFNKQFTKVLRYKWIDKRIPSGVWTKFKVAIDKKNINHDILCEKLKSCLYRVNASDIRSYEDCVDFVTVPLVGKQEKLYKSKLGELLAAKEEENNILPILTDLRMLGEGAYTRSDSKDSGKLEYVFEAIDNLEKGEKLVIWSAFRAGLDLIYERYKDRAVLVNGSTSEVRFALAKWSFNGVRTEEDKIEFIKLKLKQKDWEFDPGEASVYLQVVSEMSSLGINLPAANKQIVMSWDQLQANTEQALARIRRCDSTHDMINTIYLVSEGTTERILLERQLKTYMDNTSTLEGKSKGYIDIKEQLEELRKL